jgi:hypothetical protein
MEIYCKIGTSSQCKMKVIGVKKIKKGDRIFIKEPGKKWAKELPCRVIDIIDLGYKLYLLELF